MAWLYCPIDVQGTILGIAVDLSALPYLLRLILGSFTERASPFGRSQSAPTALVGERAISRGLVYFRSEKRVGVRSECRPLLGQAFGSEKRVGIESERRPLLGQFFWSETG